MQYYGQLRVRKWCSVIAIVYTLLHTICSISYKANHPISSDIGWLDEQTDHKCITMGAWCMIYNNSLAISLHIGLVLLVFGSSFRLAQIQHRLDQYPVILDGYPSNKMHLFCSSIAEGIYSKACSGKINKPVMVASAQYSYIATAAAVIAKFALGIVFHRGAKIHHVTSSN